MKRCSYCGVEYADGAAICAIDHRPLESSNPAPAQPPTEPEVLEEVPLAPNQEVEKIPKSEYFRCLWRIDAFDTDRLMKQFAEAGIRFKLNGTTERPIPISWEPPMPKINVYVHSDDEQKAMKIMTAHWKV